MLSGWLQHFKTLSSSSESQSFDQDYHHLVLMDTNEIKTYAMHRDNCPPR